MPDPGPRRSRISRESRLLLLTVAVCAVVLLLLARLRFPEPPPVVDTSAPPLERLAARASYDALASDIKRVEATIAPSLIVLRVAPPLEPEPHDVQDALRAAELAPGVRHVAALRTSETTAVAAVDADARIDAILGPQGGEGGEAALLAIDPVRGLARLRVPPGEPRALPQLPLAALPAPLYVVVVEGTQAGLTLRPVFLGRADRFESTRWSRPLLPLGGIAVSPGALLFSLEGAFIGMVVRENGAAAIVGASDVLDAAARLAGASLGPTDLGLVVQQLTPQLAAALGVPQGVVVSAVKPASPAAALLQPGDVITAVDDWSTSDPDELLLHLASRVAGVDTPITIVRGGGTLTVAMPAGGGSTAASEAPRLGFAQVRGVGTRIVAGGETALPGLEAGDLVVRAGQTETPTPAQLRRLLGASASGHLVLIVRRDERQRVVAVPAGVQDRAAAR